MLATAMSLSVNPMFLRHDLMIELGRLEMARTHESANDRDRLIPLETRIKKINQVLDSLSS
jgi:hypothetical protein